MDLVDVALPVPLRRSFTYAVPSGLTAPPGSRVIVPFGKRQAVGVVVGKPDAPPPASEVREIASVLEVALPVELVEFCVELARYYRAPVGEVLRLATPPLERDTEKQLRAHKEDLFSRLKQSGVAPRQVRTVRATESEVASAFDITTLRGRARELLALVRANGPQTVAGLEDTFSTARAIVQKLQEHGLVSIELSDRPADPFFRDAVARDSAPVLNEAQANAGNEIRAALDRDVASVMLLDGVTGSGKTEVYLHAIADAKSRGKGSIVLVPEIALTPQLVRRFRARFGDDVAVLHSALTPKERYTMWHRLARGEVDVAIGARSALFAPVQKLGLLIVDEEHDPSFKQDENPRYHARDMAILRAHRMRAACVLGSATPSLEAEYLVSNKRALRLELPARATTAELPKVEIVDLKNIGAGPTGDKRISVRLHRAIEETLARGEQTILFLNRRGFAPSVRCAGCGENLACPHCSVALTLHKSPRGLVDEFGEIDLTPGTYAGHLRCHYCEHTTLVPAKCGKCQSPKFVLDGLGTEKLEQTLTEAFPQARVARLDRDVASGKKVQAILDRMRDGEIDILVGTQMVTKGHDLPMVTLVGVINADAALSIPDFRAAERAFHMFVQVAGRAGRAADRPGRVLIQTYDPGHPAIAFATKHDTRGFCVRELKDRAELGYPPYSRMIVLRLDGLDDAEVIDAAHRVATAARDAGLSGVDVLGPAPAPLARLKNRFRHRVVLRGPDRTVLRKALFAAEAAMATLSSGIRVAIDVDPVHMM